MIRVILSEKPKVAESIAAAIGNLQRKKEYFEGKGFDGNWYYVTWCYGHLLEMYAKEAEGPWTDENLPLLPERFYLRPIKDDKAPSRRPEESDDEYKARLNNFSSSAFRLRVIEELFNKADEIIAATDAGREGQAIFQNVYGYVGVRKRTLRLWTSSLTEEAIADAMTKLEDNSSPRFRNMGIAAWERAVADWLVGINATRAFSLAAKNLGARGKLTVLSLGRVQTPTLCIICSRYIEHKNFKPEPFWYIDGSSVKDGKTFHWRSEDRFDKLSDGKYALDSVTASRYLTVESVDTHRNTEQPPLLHDIASLQKIANLRYGLTMETTQETAQSLYEKKLISYPRTGSRYIPEDVYKTIPSLLKSIADDADYGKFAQAVLDGGKLNRRSVDDSKITDHHGLIITGRKAPASLSETEQKVYGLVLARFVEAFSPVCVADLTKVILTAAGVRFVTKGRKDISLGWRALGKSAEGKSAENEDIDNTEIDMGELPVMNKGDFIKIGSIELCMDETKPRPLYTDATLLTALETAGKRSDNKQVTEILKDIGLGTPATRSEIMVTLVEKRKYVARRKKQLVPTELGLAVYHSIFDTSLADVEMTAAWEYALQEMEEGRGDPRGFEKKIRDHTAYLINNLRQSKGVKSICDSLDALEVKCPKCGTEMRLGDKSAWCNPKAGGCGFTVWRHIGAKAPLGKDLGDATLRKLINTGATGVISNIKGQKTNPDGTVSPFVYDAALELQEDGRISLVRSFNKNKTNGKK